MGQSKIREEELLTRISLLENVENKESEKTPVSKDAYYLVGSSLLREVDESDIMNGKAKCIRGGKIQDVKQNIKSLTFTPKNVGLLIGGNDLDNNDQTSVEETIANYTMLVAETNEKLPDSKVIISGLPPRFKDEKIRAKVKKFNQELQTWAGQQNIQFVDNEVPFELRSGDIDLSAYVTTGECPNVHLNRNGTIRLIKNLQKAVPGLTVSEMSSKKPNESYAAVVKNNRKRNDGNLLSGLRYNGMEKQETRHRGCYNCSERNHIQSQCKFGQRIRCLQCNRLGHKKKFCVD